jgi:hypothetical protein
MNQLSTGTGLAVLGLSAIACVLLSNTKLGTPAQASLTPAVATVAAAALAQTEPTIVWYGTASAAYIDSSSNRYLLNTVTRAWSDGRVEMKVVRKHLELYPGQDRFCNDALNCDTGWRIVSDANQGYAAFADLDLNGEVNGGDLSMVLLNYGDAPRQDIPSSDCPLNLVNPG